jgi:mannosyl-oligosaccharide glucosidase
MQAVVQAVTPKFQDYKPEDLPDPAYLLTLTNEVYTSANLIAIQKAFDGPFSFDIYYDSGSVKQKIDG